MELDRGELSREFRRVRTSEIKIMKAIARGSSGDPAVREDLQRQAESGDMAAQFALATALLGQNNSLRVKSLIFLPITTILQNRLLLPTAQWFLPLPLIGRR